jgi:hypothetical protein
LGKLIEDGLKSGTLLLTEGYQPSSKGARLAPVEREGHGHRRAFAEGNQLAAGPAILQAESKEEAIEQANASWRSRGTG